jgi:hypothetical protein
VSKILNKHFQEHTSTLNSRRPAISAIGAAAVLLVLASAAGGYVLYQQETAPKAAIFISTTDCGTISYEVINQDSRILSGWGVNVVVTPADSHILVNPQVAGVVALAPQGSANGTVSVTFANGSPVGTYQVVANLVNGTNTIATSNSIPCSLK